MVTAWKLTVEGMVHGVLGAGRANCCDSLWIKPLNKGDIPQLRVEGQIGVVEHSGDLTHYNIWTGEELVSAPVEVPSLSSSPWMDFEHNLTGHGLLYQSSFSLDGFIRFNFNGNYPYSIPWYQEGWVKFSKGEHQHRFWLPVHWRPSREMMYSASRLGRLHWLSDVSTLRLITPSGDLVIIKF